MTNAGLIILVVVAPFIVFVKCQERCLRSEDCWEGCCVNATCKGDGFYYECSDQCIYDDSECAEGCCIGFKCKPKTSYQCRKKQMNECTTNSDCDSGCCKDNKCQKFLSCFHFSLPTFNVKDILDTCSTSNDCFSTGKGCCVDGYCRTCTQNSPYDYDDNYHSGRRSSGMRTAGYSGLRFVIIVIAVILKLAFWMCWCLRWSSRREDVVQYKRIQCVVDGEFPREHERAVQEIPDCSPPTYSPRVPCDEYTQNSGQNRHQTQGEENVNTRESVQQGPTMGPPPAYSPRPAVKSSKNNNSAQED